jgi:hypothetical protein
MTVLVLQKKDPLGKYTNPLIFPGKDLLSFTPKVNVGGAQGSVPYASLLIKNNRTQGS